MAQGHLDRLSSVDVSFLTNESSSSHMHVGAIMIFEGPPPSYEDLLEHVQGRLHLVPRFRQKLAYPPARRAAILDRRPDLQPRYHLRHSALPSPGSEDRLRRTAGRVFSQQLDRSSPCGSCGWPGVDAEALRADHQDPPRTGRRCVGVDIATVLFDLKPVPEPAEVDRDWNPQPRAAGVHPARQGSRGPDQGAAAGGAAARRGRHASRGRGPPGWARRWRGWARSAGRSPTRRQDPAQRRDRLPPALRLGSQRPGAFQEGQERAGGHRQRRGPGGGGRRPARLASAAGGADRGARASRSGPGEHPGGGRARPAWQPPTR